MDQKPDLKVGELFVGAGGLSLGFILADRSAVNYRPIFAVDNDVPSLNSYKSNMKWLYEHAPEVLPQMPGIFNRNIEKLNIRAVLRLLKLKQGELDLLLGGPPCQGFSTSNRSRKAQSKEDRNKLINIFLDKLDEFCPKMFLIENVQGVQWTKPTQDMELSLMQDSLFPDLKVEIKPRSVEEFLVQKADKLGYYVWKQVLDAVDFGVPQHRIRFFLFGIRKDLVKSRSYVNLDIYLNNLKSLDKISVSRAIDDLPELDNGQRWQGEYYHPSDDEYVKKMRLYMANGDLYDHVTTRHAAYVIERYKKIPEGGNWRAIREEMINYKVVDNTHNNIYRRLLSSRPANTISHYRKSMIIHPKQHRGLSFREACRLQSFPDWCRFEGTINDKQQQLANAVPPLMAGAVASAIGAFWTDLNKS